MGKKSEGLILKAKGEAKVAKVIGDGGYDCGENFNFFRLFRDRGGNQGKGWF